MQGGNNFLQVNLTHDRTHKLSITLKVNGDNLETWVTHPKEEPKMIKIERIKGERQKDEVEHDTRDYDINPCECGQEDCPSNK